MIYLSETLFEQLIGCRLESYLQGFIILNDTLKESLPHYVVKINEETFLFMNRFDEVIIFRPPSADSKSRENLKDLKDLENFKYQGFKGKLNSKKYYFYNKKESLCNFKDKSIYVKRVKKFFELISTKGIIESHDERFFLK